MFEFLSCAGLFSHLSKPLSDPTFGSGVCSGRLFGAFGCRLISGTVRLCKKGVWWGGCSAASPFNSFVRSFKLERVVSNDGS